MRIARWTIFGCFLLLAACSGPRAGTDPRPERPGTGEEEENIQLSAYEDFDPAPYRDEEAGGEELVHDVPAELMEARADEGVARTVQGFRIQIAQTQDKGSADDVLAQALAWWREQGRRPNAPAAFRQGQVPVYILYRQPYYRVRVGNFTTRDEAARFMEYVNDAFPSALVVPDAVTIRE